MLIFTVIYDKMLMLCMAVQYCCKNASNSTKLIECLSFLWSIRHLVSSKQLHGHRHFTDFAPEIIRGHSHSVNNIILVIRSIRHTQSHGSSTTPELSAHDSCIHAPHVPHFSQSLSCMSGVLALHLCQQQLDGVLSSANDNCVDFFDGRCLRAGAVDGFRCLDVVYVSLGFCFLVTSFLASIVRFVFLVLSSASSASFLLYGEDVKIVASKECREILRRPVDGLTGTGLMSVTAMKPT